MSRQADSESGRHTIYAAEGQSRPKGAMRESPTEVVVHDAFLAMFWSSESGGACSGW